MFPPVKKVTWCYFCLELQLSAHVRPWHYPNNHDHMVLWRKGIAGSLHVAPESRTSSFRMTPGFRWGGHRWQREGGNAWWCQRKSCPSLCLSLAGSGWQFETNKKSRKENREVARYALLLVTPTCNTASSASTEMQQAFRGSVAEVFALGDAQVIKVSELCCAKRK